MRKSVTLLVCLLCMAATPAFATNGMLFEGYGPISHALGGASMAFDHGAAAMAANPATLGLMPDGNRVDVAVGLLMPKVKWKGDGYKFNSHANLFAMPAIGYVGKKDAWGYGIGIFSHGGMGTDYQPEFPMYSQVVIGKIMAPLTYTFNDTLTLGVTAEYVWANMDLVMKPAFDFKDSSNMTGAASGEGMSGSLGFAYKVTERFNVGGMYQLKGNIGNLKGEGATVENFDVPAFASLGVAVKLSDTVQVMADYKRIFWSDTMKTVKVSQGPVSMDLKQDWKDQDVLAVGIAYDISPRLTLRAGANFATNPIEENCMPVLPAIIKNHYTAGFGVKVTEASAVNASFGYAPEVEMKSGMSMAGEKSTISHSQHSMQVMYSYSF